MDMARGFGSPTDTQMMWNPRTETLESEAIDVIRWLYRQEPSITLVPDHLMHFRSNNPRSYRPANLMGQFSLKNHFVDRPTKAGEIATKEQIVERRRISRVITGPAYNRWYKGQDLTNVTERFEYVANLLGDVVWRNLNIAAFAVVNEVWSKQISEAQRVARNSDSLNVWGLAPPRRRLVHDECLAKSLGTTDPQQQRLILID